MSAIQNGRISRRSILKSLPALVMAPRMFAQTGGASIPVIGINHVTLFVSDLKRSVDFYQGLFGMPVLNRQGNTVISLRIGAGPQHLGLAAVGSSAPRIDHVCLGVENFNVDRITAILAQHNIVKSDTDGPMRLRIRMREGTPEIHFTDPDGLGIQLQDFRYCGGAGPLGNVCSASEPSAKKGLLAVRDWSHCTNRVSDPARSNKLYQELFGFHIQAYQGPAAPVMGLGKGVQFFMFGGGAAGAAPAAGMINHVCMTLDNFNPETVTKVLESYGIKPRGTAQGAPGPLVHYINLRMENRGGAKEGTPELYFTDPDGLPIQLQDPKYCGGAGFLGDVCRKPE